MDYENALGVAVEVDIHHPTMGSRGTISGSPKVKAKPDKHEHPGGTSRTMSQTPNPWARDSRSWSGESKESRGYLKHRTSPTGSTSSRSSNPMNRSRSASPVEDSILKNRFPYTSTPRQLSGADGTVAEQMKTKDSLSTSHPHSVSQSQISADESSVSLSLTSSDIHTTLSQADADQALHNVAVPIVGYEIMEERARFTIFKIHVQRSPHDSWYIFRRYSDFLRLNDALKDLFPHFRLALPPKKWFGDNFDRTFLEDRQLGLQAFLNNIVSHRDVKQSKPVKEFFCFDEPPGPHDSLEESRAQCEMFEEQVYTLKLGIREKDARIALLEEEINLHKAEIDNLRKALRIERFLNNTHHASPSSRSECSLPEQDQASFI